MSAYINQVMTLKAPAGKESTDVFLPDGRKIHPDANGQVTVGGMALAGLLRAGWEPAAGEIMAF